MQCLLPIHDNVTSETTEAGWTGFIARAKESGTFRGGSEPGTRELAGDGAPEPPSAQIGGFMQFEADDKAKLLKLLHSHPFVMHGGAVERCEMPRS